MLTKVSSYRFVMAFLALLMLALAACAPTPVIPQTAADPTPTLPEPTPTLPAPTATPGVLFGLDEDDILMQLDYEPGFVMPQFRYSFGRTPFFTLLADGRVIYVDEAQDGKVMVANLSAAEAEALLKQVREMGFDKLESHTDFCGKMADGTESCIADASTTIMRVRMEDGSLREIRNYANFSNGPAVYAAIFDLMNNFSHPQAAVYNPHAATLFVQMVPPPDAASPADWPLDPRYVEMAGAAGDQMIAVVLSAEEAALWQKNVGVDNMGVTFQLNGKPVMGHFVPWLPGADFSAEIAAEFPSK